MRKLLAVCVVLLVGMSVMAAAQDTPKAEVFGGYSLFHWDDQGLSGAVPPGTSVNKTMHGWNGALQFNATKVFGIVADFSGHYGTPFEEAGVGSVTGHIYNFLFGPSINFRGDKAKGFVHALFGVNRISLNDAPALEFTGGSDSAFAMALGGGFDVKVGKSFAIRPAQFDYILSNHDTGLGHQNNFRYSAGIVINLGSK